MSSGETITGQNSMLKYCNLENVDNFGGDGRLLRGFGLTLTGID